MVLRVKMILYLPGFRLTVSLLTDPLNAPARLAGAPIAALPRFAALSVSYR
jgi:hypothetical protein